MIAAGFTLTVDVTDYALIVGMHEHRDRIANTRARELARMFEG